MPQSEFPNNPIPKLDDIIMNVGAVDVIVSPPATGASTAADPVDAAPATAAPAAAALTAVEQLKSQLLAIENMGKEEEGGEIPFYFIETTFEREPIDFFPFKKIVYTPVEEIQKMTLDDVAAYRKQLQIEIIGNDDVVFNPIKTWKHAGLPIELTYPIATMKHENPMPIQAQALPVIMSGRDCIALARKGSGKTLAYVLPILRHIMEPTFYAPIGLVIAPNRDLAEHIYQILTRFTNAMPICSLAPVFRGNVTKLPLIMEIRPGIVVCTPETGYDARKIMNYGRVTFLVIDDADVIVDTGLMKQVLDTVLYTRIDRQTLVFSTTFQPDVELFARTVTQEPVEIRHVEKLDGGEVKEEGR